MLECKSMVSVVVRLSLNSLP